MAVSVQSNWIGWVTVARSAGLSRLGMLGVPGRGVAPGMTVRLAA